MILIFLCTFLSSIFNLRVTALNYTQISSKCQLSMMNRVIWHSGMIIFVVMRIRRVHNTNMLEEKLFEISTVNNQNSIDTRKEKFNLIKKSKEWREFNIIMHTFLNFFIPLIVLGLGANFFH